jgi:type VI secretion system protein ImpH
LFEALARSPHGMSFFEAIRRIDCAHPDKPPTGGSARPADDPVRLAQEPSLAFAPSTLSALNTATGGRPPRLEVLFFGLLGPNGPSPLHFTEYVRDRLRNAGDAAPARFLDLFHHRMMSLFYRAWASAQPTVSLDRPDTDRFATYVSSFIGIAPPSLRHRDHMPDLAKLHYAGHFASQVRHAGGLRAMLADYFKLPVRLVECVGQWLALPPESLCRLGESPDTGALGIATVAGGAVWETQTKFRIVFGALGFAQYERLLPGGDSLQRLVDLVRNYVGDQLDWDLQMVLEADEVPALELGKVGRLGWSTWLSTEPFTRDADDLYLNPLDYAGRPGTTGLPRTSSAPRPDPGARATPVISTPEESVHG